MMLVIILACLALSVPLGIVLVKWTQGQDPISPTLLFGLAAPLALTMIVTLGEVDQILTGMHTASRPRLGLSLSNSYDQVMELLGTTGMWYAAQLHIGAGIGPPSVAPPIRVVGVYLAVDSLIFVPAYAVALGSILRIGARAALPFAGVLRRASPVVGLLVLADWTENLLTWMAARDGVPSPRSTAQSWWRTHGIAASSGAKIGLAVVLVIAAVLVLYSLAFSDLNAFRLSRSVVASLRGHIVIVGLLGALLLLAPTVDIIRRWNWVLGTSVILLSLLLAAAVWASGRSLIAARQAETTEGDPRPKINLRGLAAVGVLVLVVWVFVRHHVRALWIPGSIALAVSGLSALTRPGPVRPLPNTGLGKVAFPRIVGLGAPFVVCLAALRAYVGNDLLANATTAQLAADIGGWSIVALAVLALLYRVFSFLEAPSRFSFVFRLVAIASFVVFGLSVAAIRKDVWAFGFLLGAVGVLLVFAIPFLWLVHCLQRVAERWQPPSFFRSLGFSRLPVFLVALLVWIPLTKIASTDELHEVRFLAPSEAPSAASAQISIGQAFTKWESMNPPAADAQPGDRTPIPLLIIATSGGGIRAAVWTSYALDCLFADDPVDFADLPGSDCASPEFRFPRDPSLDPSRAFFAASGISGGSLGLVEYKTHLLNPAPAGEDWVRQTMGDDYVAPTLAWQLFVELPNAFLRFEPDQDRAEVLERAWERSWILHSPDDMYSWLRPGSAVPNGPLANGFLQQSETSPWPLLILNGTSVEDGCRFSSSPLVAAPGVSSTCTSSSTTAGATVLHATRELNDFLCPSSGQADVPLSTAALLSARFPGISPQGRLQGCEAGGVSVVDGGYLEGAGTSTAMELWHALEPAILQHNLKEQSSCIVPYFVQIDNSFDDVAPQPLPPRPGQFSGLFDLQEHQLSNARAVAARAEARDEFSADFPGVEGWTTPEGQSSSFTRYLRLFPRAQPGSVPPLSWALSSRSMTQLSAQLRLNQDALQTFSRWFAGAVSCDPIYDVTPDAGAANP